MHLHIDPPRLVIDIQDSLPGTAAVHGFVEAALFAGAVKPAESANIDDVGIGAMDGDTADLERLLQPHVLPGFAAIGRFVDAIAPGDRVSRIVLAVADPDD